MAYINNLIEKKEKFDLEIKSIYNKVDLPWEKNARAEVKIIRHLKDDTFDVYIEKTTAMTIEDAIRPIINIDNKFEISGISVLSKNKKIIDGKTYYIATSGMLKYKKLSDIKQINIGILDDIDRPYFLYNIKINKNQSIKYVNVNPGETAKISGLKNLIVYKGEHTSAVVKYDYASMYYVPLQRDRMEVIKSLADIYLVDSTSNYLRDLSLDTKKVKTNANISGINTIFQRSKISKKLIINNKEIKSKYIGKININDSTYYDYNKKKTILGYSSSSKIGEFIPFSFQGCYKWIQEYSPFLFLKNFIFKTSVMYKNSVLNEYDGDVLLKITNSDKEVPTYFSLNQESIQIIKDNKTLSLKAIKRLSYE